MDKNRIEGAAEQSERARDREALKHWRRGTTIYRELKAMSASDEDALKVAANSRRWWRNSRLRLNRAIPIAHFDRLGVLRLT